MDQLPADLFDPVCPTSALPMRIGDKWSAMVVVCLEHGPRRFSEIRVPLRRITPKVLTETLRTLERDGMVTRTAYAVVPPRVEYELTPLGRTMLDLIEDARLWCGEHMDDLLEARRAYDARP
jgi:DNA-binding HxlR family transcriptional regulator